MGTFATPQYLAGNSIALFPGFLIILLALPLYVVLYEFLGRVPEYLQVLWFTGPVS